MTAQILPESDGRKEKSVIGCLVYLNLDGLEWPPLGVVNLNLPTRPKAGFILDISLSAQLTADIMKIKSGRLVLVIATLILSVASPVWGEAVILRNADGVEINAEILSATDNEVNIRRVRDGKEFVLKLESLDEQSREVVREWRENQTKQPTKKLVFALGNLQESFGVTVLVPEGEYNTVTHGTDTIRISFNTGTLQIRVVESQEEPNETKRILEVAREKSLGNMTPADRTKAEPLRKIVPMNLGGFSGFRTENNGSFYGRFVNGLFMIEVSLTSNDGSPITEESVALIIPTIEIKQ